MSSLRNVALFSVVLFSLLSMFLLVQHELHVSYLRPFSTGSKVSTVGRGLPGEKHLNDDENKVPQREEVEQEDPNETKHESSSIAEPDEPVMNESDADKEIQKEMERDAEQMLSEQEITNEEPAKIKPTSSNVEQRGKLICKGVEVDSEVIYWKIVPGDHEYESPITPHHDEHHDRYITFEYDAGGWNNVRMGMEILIVMAHAMGRTLVFPPPQHLYLLTKAHKDQHDKEEHDEMGFEDFFDVNLLKSHKGFHGMKMKEFLEKEGVTGGLHGILPPHNSSDVWGGALWNYILRVSDIHPMWYGKFLAMPDRPENFNLTGEHKDPTTIQRMKRFGGERSPVFYDEKLQNSHHIHFPARDEYRLLQHHYAFVFFADREMGSFYKRLIRDYMRYKDNIHCAGAELVAAIRADSLKEDPSGGGVYYALHIRRGDFQFKDVKLTAAQIVKNLHFENGTAIIPPGHIVYISTDDPDGKCVNCMVQRKPCEEYPSPRPVGCPEPTSWDAMREAGWKLRFLKDYMSKGVLVDYNPNLFGTAEVIACSRAKVFAGTFYSTFTGYIHRLRGYHGIGEDTYYHTNRMVHALRKPESVGHGFFREWRAGWTDDTSGGLI